MEKINKEIIEWAKWRWEFMRRNPQYRDDYKEVEELRAKVKKTKNIPAEERKHIAIIEDNYSKKWNINFGLLDPDKSFEDLLRMPFEENVELLSNFLNPGAVEVVAHPLFDRKKREFTFSEISSDKRKEIIGDREVTDEDFILHINFNKVNSLSSLKELVCQLIDNRYKYIYEYDKYIEVYDLTNEGSGEDSEPVAVDNKGEKIQPNRTEYIPKKDKTRSYNIDYSVLLNVGDMKERDNMTNQEVAKSLFPRDFNDENEGANPESATRKISHYYKKYKELVNDGYKMLLYP